MRVDERIERVSMTSPDVHQHDARLVADPRPFVLARESTPLVVFSSRDPHPVYPVLFDPIIIVSFRACQRTLPRSRSARSQSVHVRSTKTRRDESAGSHRHSNDRSCAAMTKLQLHIQDRRGERTGVRWTRGTRPSSVPDRVQSQADLTRLTPPCPHTLLHGWRRLLSPPAGKQLTSVSLSEDATTEDLKKIFAKECTGNTQRRHRRATTQTRRDTPLTCPCRIASAACLLVQILSGM
jgi:hypothetical protein